MHYLSLDVEKVWTLMEVLRWTADHFSEKGIDTPRLDAELIVAHALGLKRIDLYMRPEQPLTESERGLVREMIRRRLDGEPVAYISGHKEFWALPFRVTRDVLIPRPETEEVVEQAHVLLLARAKEPMRFLELGTGSGCIAAALAKEFPNAEIIATDVSAAALEVARENLSSLGYINRVVLCEGDLYEAPGDNSQPFNLIISNPPYIPSGLIDSLSDEVKSEPRMAYDGGPDGLDVIRRIISGAADLLTSGGYLVIEIHETHDKVIEKAGADTPLKFQEVKRDMAGNPRVAWWKREL